MNRVRYDAKRGQRLSPEECVTVLVYRDDGTILDTYEVDIERYNFVMNQTSIRHFVVIPNGASTVFEECPHTGPVPDIELGGRLRKTGMTSGQRLVDNLEVVLAEGEPPLAHGPHGDVKFEAASPAVLMLYMAYLADRIGDKAVHVVWPALRVTL